MDTCTTDVWKKGHLYNWTFVKQDRWKMTLVQQTFEKRIIEQRLFVQVVKRTHVKWDSCRTGQKKNRHLYNRQLIVRINAQPDICTTGHVYKEHLYNEQRLVPTQLGALGAPCLVSENDMVFWEHYWKYQFLLLHMEREIGPYSRFLDNNNYTPRTTKLLGGGGGGGGGGGVYWFHSVRPSVPPSVPVAVSAL